MSTANAATLDERISSALAGEPTSAELRALLAEAKIASATAEQDAGTASGIALDPATPPARVAEARKTMEDAHFTRDRLAVATKRLNELHQGALRREAVAARQKAVAEVSARRDAMAAELREQYPALAGALADLLHRMSKIDAECKQLAIPTSQDVARPAGTVLYQPATSLAFARLPGFEQTSDHWMWVDGQPGRAFGSEASQAAARPTITVETVRVILTNKEPGPRGFYDADLQLHMLEPGKTSPEVVMTRPDLTYIDATFEIQELGEGAPVTRLAA